jgi:hypothetical protein
MIPFGAAAPRFTIGAGAVEFTVTVAVPEIVPLVALTVLLKVPAVPPEVKRPVFGSIDPPPFTTDHTGEIAMTLPFPSRPVAANCCDEFVRSEAGFGVTVMLASAAVTVTVAVPEIEPLVALTVLANVPVEDPAVKSPPLVIVPPLAATDHVGVSGTTLPAASLPTAVYCCVAPTASDTGLGVTVIVANGPLMTMTVAVLDSAPLTAFTVFA